jgi:hypothetical protein
MNKVKSALRGKATSLVLMAKPIKSIIGASMLVAAVVGLVYAMPIMSNMVAAKSLVFKESDVPPTPSSITPYVAIVIVSSGLIIGGIALWISDRVSSDNTLSTPTKDADKNASGHRDEGAQAAAGT